MEGFDIGPDTLKNYIEVVNRANLICWNGPQGMFEVSQFSKGSVGLLEPIMKRTE